MMEAERLNGAILLESLAGVPSSLLLGYCCLLDAPLRSVAT